jgi:hypothetical protein
VKRREGYVAGGYKVPAIFKGRDSRLDGLSRSFPALAAAAPSPVIYRRHIFPKGGAFVPVIRLVRTAAVVLLVASFIVFVPGCSFLVPAKQELTIVPSDEQAEVFVNGEKVGQGRTVVKVKRGKDYAVLARVGDRAGTATVTRKISGAAIADIIGGCIILVPFLGIFSPGFWQLDPSAVTVVVPPPGGYVSPAPVTYSNPGPGYSAPSSAAPSGTTGGSRLPPQRPAR